MNKQDLINYGLDITRCDSGSIIIRRSTKHGIRDLNMRELKSGTKAITFRDGEKVVTLTLPRVMYVWDHGKINDDMQVICKDGNNDNLSTKNLKAVTVKEALIWKLLNRED